MERLAIALVAVTVIVSGCVDALNGETEPEEEEVPTDPDPEPPEDDEEINDTDENETIDEEDLNETIDDNNETVEDEENGVNETETDENETEVEAREVVIEGGDYYYEPDTVEVEENETVEFVFENTEGQHDLTLEDGEENEVASTEAIGADESANFTYTFEEDNDYEFYCSQGQHRDEGMEGTVTVE